MLVLHTGFLRLRKLPRKCVINNKYPMNRIPPSELSYRPKTRNAVRNQLGDLSRKIDAVVQAVYTSQKIKRQFKPEEHKPPIVNQ